jgi:hypothetical protein
MDEDQDAADFRTPAGRLKDEWLSLELSERAVALTAVYGRYTQQFFSDNGRIWTTAATMIPLSLGAFVGLAAIDHPTKLQIVLFSVASWLLMSFWLVIAENHRESQDRSSEVLNAIEEIWSLAAITRDAPPGSRIGRLNRILTGRNRVRHARYTLWAITSTGAALAILLWPS